jgi:hypothetical protein
MDTISTTGCGPKWRSISIDPLGIVFAERLLDLHMLAHHVERLLEGREQMQRFGRIAPSVQEPLDAALLLDDKNGAAFEVRQRVAEIGVPRHDTNLSQRIAGAARIRLQHASVGYAIRADAHPTAGRQRLTTEF